MATVNIQNFQDSENSILGIAKSFVETKGMEESSELVFNLSDCSWLQIGEIVALASYLRGVRSKLKSLTGRFDPNSGLYRYLQRMDFFTVQNVIPEERFTRHEADRKLLELTEIHDGISANDIPARLRSIVTESTSVDRSLLHALDYAFGEIIDNVLTHSRTSVKGIVAAQYYPKKSFVEFCVADCGIGVAESLRMNSAYRNLRDEELLLKAFDNGVGENTSGFNHDPSGYGCGFGLVFASRLVEATGGDLWMVSNGAAVHLKGCEKTSFSGFSMDGTVVCVRIPSNVTVTEDDLMRNGVEEPYESELVSIQESNENLLW